MLKKINSIYVYALVPIFILLILFLYQMEIKLTSTQVHISNGCDQTRAIFIRDSNEENRKLSFCDQWNKNKITLVSDYIDTEGKTFVSFDYIGFPDDKDITLFLEDKFGNHYEIKGLSHTSELWTNKAIEVPKNLKGSIALIAKDDSISKYGWIGIGNLTMTNIAEEVMLKQYVKTLTMIILYAFILSIIFGVFLQNNNILEAYIFMTLLVGVSAYVAFNGYLISKGLGYTISTLGLIFVFYAAFAIESKNYKKVLWIFVSLVSMSSIIFFLAYSNFPHQSSMAVISADKWHHFPVDNWLPKIFADSILRGHINSPMAGDWLSSDRPPLQTGLFLLFGSFMPTDLLYLVVTVGAQLLVIVFIILLLNEVFNKKIVFFVGILILFNGFVFANALFVWPKLFSSVYQGIAFYYLYKIWKSTIRPRHYYILFGLSSILAFLAHGGAIFYLMSLSILLLFTVKNKQNIINVFYGLLTSILLYIPWVIYQKFIDPPGDRLLKWHLTNQHVITDESFLTVFINYYQQLVWSEWIALKTSHITMIFHSMFFDIFKVFELTNNRLKDNIFFSVDYSYLFFSIGFLLLYFFIDKKLKIENFFIKLILFSFLIYLIVWVLILVSGTVIHQGSHFGWFSGFIGLTLIVFYFNKYLFYIFTALNIIIFIKVYVIGFIFDRDIISSSIFILMTSLYILNVYKLVTSSFKVKEIGE